MTWAGPVSTRTMRLRLSTLAVIAVSALSPGCSRPDATRPGGGPSALSEVPAVRLNFRYEPDVPPPDQLKEPNKEERNAAVQGDFDANRPQEILDKTFASPDAKRVAAIYHKSGDLPSEFRL